MRISQKHCAVVILEKAYTYACIGTHLGNCHLCNCLGSRFGEVLGNDEQDILLSQMLQQELLLLATALPYNTRDVGSCLILSWTLGSTD